MTVPNLIVNLKGTSTYDLQARLPPFNIPLLTTQSLLRVSVTSWQTFYSLKKALKDCRQ